MKRRRVALTFIGKNSKPTEVVISYSAKDLGRGAIKKCDLIAAQAATEYAMLMEKSA